MKRNDINAAKLGIHALFLLISLMYILPLVLVISVSLSSEAAITSKGAGYSLLPRNLSLDAYRLAFANPESMVRAYAVTAFQAVAATLGACLVLGMVAYPLSRTAFAYRRPITFFIFFTMLFGGGTIPTYIVYTQWYHLGNTIWVYILPSLAGGAWNTFMVRTYFRSLSESLYESANLDGANEFTIFLRIVLPLSTPIFAAIGFLMLVGRWSDWQTSLIYIRNSNLYTLQYLLQRVLNEVDFLKGLATDPPPGIAVESFTMPMETLRYALCVIAAGPMLVIFPFFQKYFSKGLTIGSVKG